MKITQQIVDYDIEDHFAVLKRYSVLPDSFKEDQRVVKRRTYHTSLTGVIGVLVQLRENKFTGQVAVNMSQGGLSSVTAEWTERC